MPRRKRPTKPAARPREADRSPEDTSSSNSSSSDKVSDICYPDVEVVERSVRGESDGDRGLEVSVIWAGQTIGRRTVDRIRGWSVSLDFSDGRGVGTSLESLVERGEGSAAVSGSNFVFRLPQIAVSGLNPVTITCDRMLNLYVVNTQETYLGTKTDSHAMRRLFCGSSAGGSLKNEEIFNYLEFRYLLETWKRFRAIGIPYPEIELIPDTLYLGFNREKKNGLFIKIVHLTAREHMATVASVR